MLILANTQVGYTQNEPQQLRAWMTIEEYIDIRLGIDRRPRTAFENRMLQLYDGLIWDLNLTPVRGQATADLLIREFQNLGYDARTNYSRRGGLRGGSDFVGRTIAMLMDNVTDAQRLVTQEDIRRREPQLRREAQERAEQERRRAEWQRQEQQREREREQQRRQDSIRAEQERVRAEQTRIRAEQEAEQERQREIERQFQNLIQSAQRNFSEQNFQQARQNYLSAIELRPERADIINPRISEIDTHIAEQRRQRAEEQRQAEIRQAEERRRQQEIQMQTARRDNWTEFLHLSLSTGNREFDTVGNSWFVSVGATAFRFHNRFFNVGVLEGVAKIPITESNLRACFFVDWVDVGIGFPIRTVVGFGNNRFYRERTLKASVNAVFNSSFYQYPRENDGLTLGASERERHSTVQRNGLRYELRIDWSGTNWKVFARADHRGFFTIGASFGWSIEHFR